MLYKENGQSVLRSESKYNALTTIEVWIQVQCFNHNAGYIHAH